MLIFSILIAFLGSFLFGYTTSVISGAILFISQEFQLSALQEGVIVSIILFGAMLGSAVGGIFPNRRQALIVTGAVFVVGIALSAIAKFEFILLGRAITGIALGLSSMVVPIYLAEISPASYRGRIGSMNQIGMALGLFVAFLVSYLFSSSGNWQLMFSLGLVPALALFIGMFFAIQTPSRIDPHDENIGFLKLFSPQFKTLVISGIFLGLAQQLTGINVVNYYAPLIFEKVGYNSPQSATYVALGIGVVSVLAAFLTTLLIDKWGRIPLFSISLIGMTLALTIFLIVYFYFDHLLALVAPIAFSAYTVFFTLGMGSALWVYLSEMFPSSIRGKAMSIVVLINWMGNYFISLAFPYFVDNFGVSNIFAFFALSCLVMFIFIRKLPETKGKKLA